MKQYQYKLAKRGKWVCPECGHKTFVCYVDDEGQILSEEVGKCDRADNCNYHYPPREYFRDNGLNLKPATLSRPSSRPKNNVRPKPTYIDPEMFKTSVMATSGENNNLVHYLTTVFDDEEVRTMIQRYYIGTSRHWPGSTVFYQIDTYGNIHRGKIMQYDATSGKRVKIPFSKVTSVHSVLGMSDNLPPQCLFGEHLLSGNTDDMIAIVESEKTAIIASTWLDGGITMACGGCGNLTPSLLAPLYGRYVLLIPDNGKYEEWKDKARQMSNDFRRKSGCICITDIMERYAENEGDDIGDLILTRRDEWNRMPDNCFAMEDISGVTIL